MAMQTPVQAQQAKATAAINGSKAATTKAAPAPAAPATAPAAKPTAEKWTTVTVTATTPPFSLNRAHVMDIAYDAARINGVAVLKLDGKAAKTYVRCADGTVRSAKSPLAVEALAAHTKA